MISSANSRLVHWLIGRPHWLGASQARDMIWQTCSGVIRAGAPGRGASRNLSSILRSSRMAACSPSQRLRQNRTVSTSRPTSRAIWLLFRPAAADRMILPRRANCWGVLYRRTRVSNPCCSSGDNSTTGGFGPRIAFTTTLHLSNLNALIILLGLFSPPVLEVWPESHWPGFALRQADVFQSYTAW